MVAPAVIAAGIAAAASLAGGALTGRNERKAAKHANEMSMWQQIQNQKWSEYMSNTAHQREVEDLKQAGLNPVLSANGGAATTGGGIGNTPQTASTDWSGSAKGVSDAIEKYISMKSLDNQTKSTEADKGLKETQTKLTTTQEKLTDIQKQNAQIENQILNSTKNDIIDTTKATKAAEKAEAEVKKGNALIDKENQSSSLWRFAKGFSDISSLLVGPMANVFQMAGSAKKAAALGEIARKPTKERMYDRNGKHYLKEYEYE